MSRKKLATLALWGAGFLLLFWALRRVSWPDLWAILRSLSPAELALLILLNIGVLLALTRRWQAFVATLPQAIPFSTLFKARLASFSVSYFTPGPQFGGEPMQVIALHQKQIPASLATATVALDKLVELLVNFTVLGLGVVALWSVGIGDVRSRTWVSILALSLISIPGFYLFLLWRKKHPFAALFRWMAARRGEGKVQRGLSILAESEALAGELARTRPVVFLHSLVWASLAWALMLLEYALSARFLGASLSPVQTLAALAAARFAFLLPMPGGLGALSASQVLVFGAMGFDPNSAMALVLYIRGRDLITGAIGALLAARMVR